MTKQQHLPKGSRRCNACRNDIYGDDYFGCFAYFCEHCNNTKTSFCLDAECASVIMPAITYEGYDHLLQFNRNITKTNRGDDEQIIKHSLHGGKLWLSEKKKEDRVPCNACRYDCVGPTYSCRDTYWESECMFNLHESCAKLPQELHNPPFHPHPLSLQLGNYDECNACRQSCWGLTFSCNKCWYFKVDVECAFIRPAAIEEGEEGTHHLSRHHQHPLLLVEKIPTYRIQCRVCGGYCSDLKTYGCLQCCFFLHPWCLNDLPEEIFHPFHPYHPLTLKLIKDPLTLKLIKGPLTLKPIKDKGSRRCNACRNDIYGGEYLGCFAYFCEHCNNTKTSFCLDAECASVIMPAITYEGHDHLLQFNHNITKTNRGDDEQIMIIKDCSACKSTCKSTCESYRFRCLDLHFHDTRGTDERIKCSACSKSITSKSYAFRCLDLGCDFNLHLTCGPLPYTIQHKSHIHPLILTNCPIEDEEDCEPDEFFCYACEEERDPFLPIYYCKECPFVAGISCIISEVVSLLKGEHGDVELRNIPFGQFGNLIREKQEQRMIKPALTLSNIFNSLSKAEKNELKCALRRTLHEGLGGITSGDWECTEIISG